MEQRNHLSVWSKLSFALGGAPYQITGCVLGFFLQIFLLDVAQLDPFYVSIILFVGRAWDALTDPAVGFLVCRSRWTTIGRMMPWIIGSTPFAVLTYLLLWCVPPFEEANVIWYLALYCLFQSMLTCFHVPYSALTMFISSDQKERDSVTAYRMTVEMLATVVATTIQGQLVGRVSSCPADDTNSTNWSRMNRTIASLDETKQAYLSASVVICSLYLLCAAGLFLGVKELKEIRQKKAEPLSFRQGLLMILTHEPYIKLICSFLFTSLSFMLIQGNFALYITYALGQRKDFQNILLVIMLSGTLAIPWWQWFLTRFGKKTAVYYGVLWAVPFMILFLFAKSSVIISYVVSLAAGVSVASTFLLPWSMLPDVVDDFKVKNPDICGHEALFYSFYVFFIKFSSGLSLGVSTLCLKFAGYVTGSCSQPEMVSLTLKMLICPVPIVLIAVGLLVLKTYPIDEERRKGNRRVLQEIILRRSLQSQVLVTPPPVRPLDPDAGIQSDIADAPDVSVTCSTSDFVLRVKPAFYGLGADAQELTLGRSCKSNGVLKPQGDLLFQYPLTACDGVRELSHGYVVYKNILHYQPSTKRFPTRAHQLKVNIECHYQRDHSVHQLAVQPTWQTLIVHKKLKGRPMGFQIKLMDDSWEKPAKTQSYLLGQTVNLQVSAPQLLSEEKLYINSCYATPSSGSKSSLKYTIIDNYGCMLDSKQDPGASQFVSRTHKTLRFSLKAFQFTADPDTEVSIHCKVIVTSEGPGPAHKSCTYQNHRWRALTGDDSICECCESKCVTSKSRRALMEGSASSRPLLVSDHLYTAEDGFLSLSPSAVRRKENAEMHSDKIWESVDIEKHDAAENEKQKLDGEPDLDELGYKKTAFKEDWSKVGNFNKFGEDGTKEFSQPEEAEVRFVETEILEKPVLAVNENGDVPRRWMKLEQMVPAQIEPQLNSSESENEKRTHNCKGDKDGRMTASQVQLKTDSSLTDAVDGEEKTWYFTWR
ncbi:uncharacterized protein FYW49_010658 [Xenentodon cancila]